MDLIWIEIGVLISRNELAHPAMGTIFLVTYIPVVLKVFKSFSYLLFSYDGFYTRTFHFFQINEVKILGEEKFKPLIFVGAGVLTVSLHWK